jgi:NADH dehydrogenase (ubiquinone) 1 beta subcomplex subunit 3
MVLADQIRSMFPGLGTAIVAFTAYVIYDDFIAAKPKHDSHGHGSGH